MKKIQLKINSYGKVFKLCDSMSTLANSSLVNKKNKLDIIQNQKEVLENILCKIGISFPKPTKRLFLFSQFGFCGSYNSILKKKFLINDYKYGLKAPKFGNSIYNIQDLWKYSVYVSENNSIKIHEVIQQKTQYDYRYMHEINKNKLIEDYKKIFAKYCLYHMDYWQTVSRLKSLTNAKNKTDELLNNLKFMFNLNRQKNITEEISIIICGNLQE